MLFYGLAGDVWLSPRRPPQAIRRSWVFFQTLRGGAQAPVARARLRFLWPRSPPILEPTCFSLYSSLIKARSRRRVSARGGGPWCLLCPLPRLCGVGEGERGLVPACACGGPAPRGGLAPSSRQAGGSAREVWPPLHLTVPKNAPDLHTRPPPPGCLKTHGGVAGEGGSPSLGREAAVSSMRGGLSRPPSPPSCGPRLRRQLSTKT